MYSKKLFGYKSLLIIFSLVLIVSMLAALNCADAGEHCKFIGKSLDRISDEVWNERGPFGIFLEDELSHLSDRMMADPSAWEDLGFYTLMQANGEDLYLATLFNFRASGPSVTFLLTQGEYNKDEVDFKTVLSIASIQEKISVIKEKKRVIWKSPHLKLIAIPPVWYVQGEYEAMGTGTKVKINLLFKQLDKEFWIYWPGYNPDRTGKGLHAPMTVDGVIYIDGKKYEIKNGISTYERVVMPSRGTQEGMGNQDWINAFCGDTMNFLVYKTGFGSRQGFLNVQTSDGKQHINLENVDFSVEKKMLDWRTGREVPVIWHVTGNSPRGTFEATCSSFAAVLLGTIEQSGFDIYHHLVSVKKATFTPTGGDPVTAIGGLGTNEARIIPPMP